MDLAARRCAAVGGDSNARGEAREGDPSGAPGVALADRDGEAAYAAAAALLESLTTPVALNPKRSAASPGKDAGEGRRRLTRGVGERTERTDLASSSESPLRVAAAGARARGVSAFLRLAAARRDARAASRFAALAAASPEALAALARVAAARADDATVSCAPGAKDGATAALAALAAFARGGGVGFFGFFGDAATASPRLPDALDAPPDPATFHRALATALVDAGVVEAFRDAAADDAAGPRRAALAANGLANGVLFAAETRDARRGGAAATLVERRIVPAAMAALDPARAAAERGAEVDPEHVKLDARPGGDVAAPRAWRAATARDVARALRLPFVSALPPAGTPLASAAETALTRYQETLLAEAAVVSLVQALDDALDEDDAARGVSAYGSGSVSANDARTTEDDARVAFAREPVALVSQLTLRSGSYAAQFVEAGGLDPTLTKRLLDPRGDARVLVDALLMTSQLARLSADKYPAIARAGACAGATVLLEHADPGVRARACNLLGNVCRHSGYFYGTFAKLRVVRALAARCADPDPTTRKFACFALGNAGFHSDALYGDLRDAVAPLVRSLRDSEEKTRANAAAALGNLVRNSDALCAELIREDALEALAALAAGDASSASGGASKSSTASDGQSPAKIALFSLGNLCTHGACRDALVAAGFERRVAALAEAPDADATVKKYVARIRGKIAAGSGKR